MNSPNDGVILDSAGYPLRSYNPGGGPIGRHGPLGYYVHASPQEREEAERQHLETCNQCRREAGLSFDPRYPWSPAS